MKSGAEYFQQKRAKLEAYLAELNQELEELEEIVDEGTLYDQLLKAEKEKIEEKIPIVEQMIEKIKQIQTFYVKFSSSEYTIKPSSFEIYGLNETLPQFSFNVFDNENNEVTDVMFKQQICGLVVSYEFNGTSFVETERSGEYSFPNDNVTIVLDNGLRG